MYMSAGPVCVYVLYMCVPVHVSVLHQKVNIAGPDTRPVSSRLVMTRVEMRVGRGSLGVGKSCKMAWQKLLCSKVAISANLASTRPTPYSSVQS